jgi:hypothetical protein
MVQVHPGLFYISFVGEGVMQDYFEFLKELKLGSDVVIKQGENNYTPRNFFSVQGLTNKHVALSNGSLYCRKTGEETGRTKYVGYVKPRIFPCSKKLKMDIIEAKIQEQKQKDATIEFNNLVAKIKAKDLVVMERAIEALGALLDD